MQCSRRLAMEPLSPVPCTPVATAKPLIRRQLGRTRAIVERSVRSRSCVELAILPELEETNPSPRLTPIKFTTGGRGPLASAPRVKRQRNKLCQKSVMMVSDCPSQNQSPNRPDTSVAVASYMQCHVSKQQQQSNELWWSSLSPAQMLVEREWQSKLTPLQFRVLRMKATEEQGSGPLLNWCAAGSYVCAGCGSKLYKDEHKIPSTCGWPAFKDSVDGAICRHGENVPELACAGCNGHIGHAFKSERYPPPHHERHCVNSASLRFVPAAFDDSLEEITTTPRGCAPEC